MSTGIGQLSNGVIRSFGLMSFLSSFDVGVVFGCGEGKQKSIIRRTARVQSSMLRRYKSGVALPRMGWAICSELKEFWTNMAITAYSNGRWNPASTAFSPTRTACFSTTMILNIQPTQSQLPGQLWSSNPSLALDLNPIENLWSILDMKDRSPKNEKQLFEILQVARHSF